MGEQWVSERSCGTDLGAKFSVASAKEDQGMGIGGLARCDRHHAPEKDFVIAAVVACVGRALECREHVWQDWHARRPRQYRDPLPLVGTGDGKPVENDDLIFAEDIDRVAVDRLPGRKAKGALGDAK